MNLLYFASLFVFVGGPLLAGTATGLVGGRTQTAWFGTIPNIFVVSLNIPISQASDFWGRKWLMTITCVFGVIGAVVESRAQSIGALLAGFCLLGLSLGNLSLLAAIVSEVVPRRHRANAQASMNFSGSVGGVLALVTAGKLASPSHPEGFRIYWYIVAGLYAICTAFCFFFYNPPPRELQVSLSLSAKLGQVDWVGYALLPAALTLFCVALTWSKNPYEWDQARILAPFITSFLLVAILVFYEWRGRRDGMLHHDLFSRNFVIAIIVLFCEGLSFFAANTYIAFEVSTLHGLDLFDSGLRFMMSLLAATVSSVVVGLYSTWRKDLRWPMTAGCLSLVLFNTLMATITTSTTQSVFWVYPIFAGIGVGSLVSTTTTCAQLSTPPSLIATASAIIVSARSLGAAVGVAVNNAIFNGALSDNVPKRVADAVLPLGFPASGLESLIPALMSGDADVALGVSGATPSIVSAGLLGLKKAYVVAFRSAWIAAACIICLSVLGK